MSGLVCNVYAKIIDKVRMYRGLVSQNGHDVWAGPWRVHEYQAHNDAENGARIVSFRDARRGRVMGNTPPRDWPLSRDVH